MNQPTFDLVAAELLLEAASIQTAKRPGYTLGNEDVLRNFKAAAERAGITVGQAWSVLFNKHVDAILAIMTRPDLPISEAPIGRFSDAINYLQLGYALLKERESETVETKPGIFLSTTSASVFAATTPRSSTPSSPDANSAGKTG